MTDGLRAVPASQARAHALAHTKGPLLDETWENERWSMGAVLVVRLRTAHEDFDNVPLTKNELMVDILNRSRHDILTGKFPRAVRIMAGGDLPAVMLESDDADELFVADGQGRVLTALWHGIERIDAYVFRRPGVRPLP